ncbi:MAG TPA: hypothetical protein VJN02_10505 [Gammaproteobacteria bacterium]|nr:hypothetical protein [Gammaproteobacteria bacterium]
MTILTGRRRVGKTMLALHHVQDKRFVYLFVGRKEEHLLCQEFLEETFSCPLSVIFDIQKLWDLNKTRIKLHVIYIGSVYSLMHKIFQDKKQPLFGRATRFLKIKAFSLQTLATLLKENKMFTFVYKYIINSSLIRINNIFINHLMTHMPPGTKQGEPNWSLLSIPNIEKLPALQWKVMNVKKMDGKKHKSALENLKRILEL